MGLNSPTISKIIRSFLLSWCLLITSLPLPVYAQRFPRTQNIQQNQNPGVTTPKTSLFGQFGQILGSIGPAVSRIFQPPQTPNQCPVIQPIPSDYFTQCQTLPTIPPEIEGVCEDSSIGKGGNYGFDIQGTQQQVASTMQFRSSCLTRYEKMYQQVGLIDANTNFPTVGVKCVDQQYQQLTGHFVELQNQLAVVKNGLETERRRFMEEQDSDSGELKKLRRWAAIQNGNGLDGTDKEALKNFANTLRAEGSACNASLAPDVIDGTKGLTAMINSLSTGNNSVMTKAKQVNPDQIEREINKAINQLAKYKADDIFGSPAKVSTKINRKLGVSRPLFNRIFQQRIGLIRETYKSAQQDAAAVGITIGEEPGRNSLDNINRTLSSSGQIEGQYITQCANDSVGHFAKKYDHADGSRATTDSGLQQYARKVQRVIAETSNPANLVKKLKKLYEKYNKGKYVIRTGETINGVGGTSGTAIYKIYDIQLNACKTKVAEGNFNDATSGGASDKEKARLAKDSLRKAKVELEGLTSALQEDLKEEVLTCSERELNTDSGICQQESTYNIGAPTFCVAHTRTCKAAVLTCYDQLNQQTTIRTETKRLAKEYNRKVDQFNERTQGLINGLYGFFRQQGRRLQALFNGEPGVLFQLPKGKRDLLAAYIRKVPFQGLDVEIKGGVRQEFLDVGPMQIDKMIEALETQMRAIDAKRNAQIASMTSRMNENSEKFTQLKNKCSRFISKGNKELGEQEQFLGEERQKQNIAAQDFCALASSFDPTCSEGELQELAKAAATAAGEIDPQVAGQIMNDIRISCARADRTAESDERDFEKEASALCRSSSASNRERRVRDYIKNSAKGHAPAIALELSQILQAQVTTEDIIDYMDGEDVNPGGYDQEEFEQALFGSRAGNYISLVKEASEDEATLCTGSNEFNRKKCNDDFDNLQANKDKDKTTEGYIAARKDHCEAEKENAERTADESYSTLQVLLSYQHQLKQQDQSREIASIGQRAQQSCSARFNGGVDGSLLGNALQGFGQAFGNPGLQR